MALTRAEQMNIGFQRDAGDILRERRLADRMEAQTEELERQAEARNAARRRRLESQNLTALADPGRYAPQVYRQAKEWFDGQRLRQHELDMLNAQNKGAVNLQEKKNIGLREQGMEAARINAQAGLDLEKLRGDNQRGIRELELQTGLTQAEKELATRERIAGMEHGTVDANGRVTPGSRERTAQIAADAEVNRQAEANKGLSMKAEAEREKQERDLESKIRVQIAKAGGRVDAAKVAGYSKIISDAIRSGQQNGTDISTTIAELRKGYQNNKEMLGVLDALGGQSADKTGGGPKEGDRKRFANGEAVFRNGHWEKI